jgi:PAS domain S-box-containing protein
LLAKSFNNNLLSDNSLVNSYNNSSEGILIFQDNQLVYWNRVILEYIGNTKEILTLEKLLQHLHPDDVALFNENFTTEVSSAYIYKPFNYRIFTDDGRLKSILMNQLVLTWNNEPALLCILNDITKYRHYEDELKLSREKYKSIVENVEEGLYETDVYGNIIFANESCSRFFGFPRQTLIGMNYKKIVSKDYADQVYQVFNKVYKTGESAELEQWSLVNNNNNRVLYNASVSLVKDKKGAGAGFRGIIRDVTEKVQSENILKKSEEKYRLIVENISDTIYKIQRNGYLTFINKSVFLQTGYNEGDLLNKYYLDFVAEEHREEVKNLMEDLLQKDEGYSTYHQFKVKTLNSKELWVGQTVKIVYNRTLHEKELYIVARDITHIKTFENMLEESEKKYRELVEQKTSDIFFSLNSNYIFETANVNMTRLLGYSEKEIKTKSIFDIFHHDSMDSEGIHERTIIELFEKVLQKGKKNISFKVSCTHRNTGEAVVFNFKIDPVYHNDEITGITGLMYPHAEDPMISYLKRQTIYYEIDNKIITISNVVQRLTRDLKRDFPQAKVDQITMALLEIIMNAIEHGNLAISFEEKSKAKDEGRYFNLIRERLQLKNNKNKKVYITYTHNEAYIQYLIRDEGKGFNYKEYLNRDLEDLNSLMVQNGRGIAIAANVFDVIKFNDSGNEVSLIKYII